MILGCAKPNSKCISVPSLVAETQNSLTQTFMRCSLSSLHYDDDDDELCKLLPVTNTAKNVDVF